MKKILVPISFSNTSKNAIHHANAIARKYNASVSLLHCYPAQEYNRDYDFGKVDYDTGIKDMLENFYLEDIDKGESRAHEVLTFVGSVSDAVTKISSKFDLMLMSRNIGFNSKPRNQFSEKTFHISTQSLCPVLITAANQIEFSFQSLSTIWHIERNEDEKEIVKNNLNSLNIDPKLVITKSLQQTSFVSAFWQSIVSYTNTHDNLLLKNLPQSFEEEHIDLLLFVNSLKGMFELFVKDEAFQIISQFSVPILIFQDGK